MGQAAQKEIPGVHDEVVKVPVVTRAAKAYVEARNEFQEASSSCAERKATLVELMKKHGLESYRASGLTIELVHGKDSVKVKLVEDGAEDED